MIEVTIRTLCREEPATPQYQLIVTGQCTAAETTARTAVSALVQSLTCQLAQGDWLLLEDFSLDGVPGTDWCAITAVPTADGLPLVQGAFALTAAGFGLLARQYPAQLQLTRQEAVCS